MFLLCGLHWLVSACYLTFCVVNDLSFGKTGNSNVQLVLQNCCWTSWKAMLSVLPPTSVKPVNNLICCKTGLVWVLKLATSLFDSFCRVVAWQVARFLSPVFPYHYSSVTVWEILQVFKFCQGTSVTNPVNVCFLMVFGGRGIRVFPLHRRYTQLDRTSPFLVLE